MNMKKIGKALLFPHIAVMIVLVPLSAFLLIYTFAVLGNEGTVIPYISYVVSAYTLTVWCFRIPRIVRFFKTFKEENVYARIWLENTRIRVNVLLLGSFVWNAAYGILQLVLGVYHRSLWFYSLAVYYILLAFMRIYLMNHTRKFEARENMADEWKKYRFCGWTFLLMNVALTVITFFIVFRGQTVRHTEVVTISMAAYTFTSFTVAIINIFAYKKYNSPVYSASKAVSLAAATVSMMSLEATMLKSFGGSEMSEGDARMMLAMTGVAIFAFINFMALYMIIRGTKRLNNVRVEEGKE